MLTTRSLTRTLTRSLLTIFNQTLTPTLRRHHHHLRRPISAVSQFRHHAPARWCSFTPEGEKEGEEEPFDLEGSGYTREMMMLEGCDYEHWLVVMQDPETVPERDVIIDRYIKILAVAVGSEEEARMRMYSVSTKHYYAFGAQMSEEQADKLKEFPGVVWVLPDSYLDIQNKDYGGEPFINGQAVPYDPKYHEEWVRNNARQTEGINWMARPDGPNQSEEPNKPGRPQGNMGGPPTGGGTPPNMGGPPTRGGAPPNMGGPPTRGGAPPNMGGPPTGGAPPNKGGMPPQYGDLQPNDMGYPPYYNAGHNMGGGAPPNMGGMPPQYGDMQPNGMGYPPNYNAGPNMGEPPMRGGAPPYIGGMPPEYGDMQPNEMGYPPNYNAGHNMGGYPNNQQNFNYSNEPINGSVPYHPNPNQDNFPRDNGNPCHDPNYPGRDYQ